MNNNQKQAFSAARLARAAVVAALYVVLTVAFQPLSYAVQIRFSEALTILPLFMPEAIVGLTVGCLISNIFSFAPIDMLIGTLATLVAAILTRFVAGKLKKPWLKFLTGGAFPVALNAVTVPITILIATSSKEYFFFNMLTVFLGEFAAVYVLGGILFFAMIKIYRSNILYS